MQVSWALLWCAAPTAFAWSPPTAEAREAASFDVPAGTLPQSLQVLARQGGISIGADSPLPDVRTPAIRGAIPLAEALARLLAGSGFVARRISDRAWRIEPAPRPIAPAPVKSAPLPPSEGPPIVVTATKQLWALQDAPMAIAAVLADDHRSGSADAARGSAWLAGQVDGLAMTDLGPGRNRLFVRGLADSPFNGPNQSTVAILLDGARLTYAAPDPDLRLVDVERVELLKGPQGSLYGTGALGGVYQITARAPDADAASLSGEASAALTGGSIGGSVSAVLNLPLVTGSSALRGVAYQVSQPGWISTGDRKAKNRTNVAGGRLAFRQAIDGDWLLDATAVGQFINSRDSQYVYAPGTRTRPDQLPEPHDNDLRHLALRLDRNGQGMRIHLASSVTWHEVTDRADATVGATGLGVTAPRVLSSRSDYRTWDNEARLSSEGSRLHWLAGASYLVARTRSNQTLLGQTAGDTAQLADERSVSSEAALFGQVSLPLASALDVTLGARGFLASYEQSQARTVGQADDDRRKKGVTPSLAIAWKPQAGRLVYARFDSAFRQGRIEQGSTASSVAVYRGDEISTLSAGWRETLGSGGVGELGLFLSHWDHLQSDVLDARSLPVTIEAGDARIFGIEASYKGDVTQGWHVDVGGSVQSAVLVRNAIGFRLEDRHLPVVPLYQARGALQKDWSPGSSDVFARIELAYLGPSRLSFDPALDRKQGRALDMAISAGLSRGRTSLALRLDNPLNTSANLFAHGNPFRIVGQPQFTPQPSRTVSLSLAVR